ncbi:MAG TPA: T9SS type A sorting domain-containing protein [Saprospiraceae bacterium]|nr:T9SS type A sorting domain-containing protein [Saprospiraceae bacterium]
MIKIFLSILFFYLNVSILSATTIIPPDNLGILANNADAVVLVTCTASGHIQDRGKSFDQYTLKISQCLKGSFNKEREITLNSLGYHTEEMDFLVLGEPEFVVGQEYFVFLDNGPRGWRLQMMAWGVFETQFKKGSSYLVPIEASNEFQIAEKNDYTPLKVYPKDALIRLLNGYLNNKYIWDESMISTNLKIEDFRIKERAAPAHCTFLVANGIRFRWTGFKGTALPVRYDSVGDNYFGGANTQVENALVDLNSNYTGINLANGNTHGYIPDCTTGSAAGGNFISYILNTYGSSRNALVIYNDPCDEITDLTNCSGILAVGGLYGSGMHSFDGTSWWSGAYGYVIVNDSTGACLTATQYKRMITHELTHSLGIGHISGNGTANMNPTCCIAIQNLDIECLNYTYPIPPAPINLLSFEGEYINNNIELRWETASERNNAFFTVERSKDGRNFEEIAIIKGSKNSSSAISYKHLDKNPFEGINYYRLKQTDYDRQYEFFNIISIYKPSDQKYFVFHDWHANKIYFLTNQIIKEAIAYKIISMSGEIYKSGKIDPADNSLKLDLLDTSNLPPAIYYVQLSRNTGSECFKILIN